MGQTIHNMLASFDTGCNLEVRHGLHLKFDLLSLDEFAACIKRFANNKNKGWISQKQLERGFQHTNCAQSIKAYPAHVLLTGSLVKEYVLNTSDDAPTQDLYNIDQLLLLGLLHCKSTDSEMADMFLQIV